MLRESKGDVRKQRNPGRDRLAATVGARAEAAGRGKEEGAGIISSTFKSSKKNYPIDQPSGLSNF